MAYNKSFGKAVKSAGKPESRRNSRDKKDSPLEFDWGSVMDYGQGALTVAGMVPGLGNVADIANTAISGGRAAYAKYTGDEEGYKHHRNAAAINAAAAIPGAGLAVGGAKLAKAGVTAAKAAKAAKGADKMVDSAKLVKKAAEQKLKSKAAQSAGKTFAKDVAKTAAVEGSIRLADKAGKPKKPSKKQIAEDKTNQKTDLA